MRRSPKEGGLKKHQSKKEKRTSYWKKNSWLLIKLLRSSYSGYVEDSFCVLFSQFFFQTTHDRYLFSKIRLVLSLTLYKFIVWACWAKTQFCLGSKPKLVLTIYIYIYIYIYILRNIKLYICKNRMMEINFLKWFNF